MKNVLLLLILVTPAFAYAQPNVKPCAQDPNYRQFDFWIGDWDVFGVKGKKAGDSHVELMLDSCVIYENWTSAGNYAGKSFNTYNSAIKKWQQTWVDDKGGLTEYFGD